MPKYFHQFKQFFDLALKSLAGKTGEIMSSKLIVNPRSSPAAFNDEPEKVSSIFQISRLDVDKLHQADMFFTVPSEKYRLR